MPDPTVTHDVERHSRDAVAILNRGNGAHAGITDSILADNIDLEAIGLYGEYTSVLRHEPLAATLSCSDARVPVELIFDCGINDLFVTRVAGNTAGSDVIGSLEFAVSYLHSVGAIVVLGHSWCGAVTAAVDAHLLAEEDRPHPHGTPLGGIIEAVLPNVTLSDEVIDAVHGPDASRAPRYRDCLVAVATVVNAAANAMALARELDREIHFGVYNLSTRIVGIPGPQGIMNGLHPSPADQAALGELATHAARAVRLTN